MKDYLYNNQGSLFGGKGVCIGFGDNEFEIKEIDRNLANDLIVKNHYSKKFYTATYIHLGMFYKDELVGVLQYGYAMNPASQEGVVSNTGIKEYLELNRMWIDDKMEKGTASKAISYSIKFIKKKYPKIKWIQSFADERCHKFGIVYQAANFKYCGEHTSDFWVLDDIWYHKSLMERDPKLSKSAAYLQANRDKAKSIPFRQFRYIYFIKKGFEKFLNFNIQPYPKHYAE